MVCIGTHSGTFHCDEALGCFLLRQTPQFRDADIVRSRDPEVLKDLDVVIDVGGTYEPGQSLLHCTALSALRCQSCQHGAGPPALGPRILVAMPCWAV